MSYWDSSALLKLFAVESDSAVFREHVRRDGDMLVTSELTRLEVWSALRRKESEGEINHGGAGARLANFDLGAARACWRFVILTDAVRVEFERIIERCCSHTPPIFIRTLDALHLASARVTAETEIVATDRRLRDAATLLGFQLFLTPTL